jgi:hypothetical protein
MALRLSRGVDAPIAYRKWNGLSGSFPLEENGMCGAFATSTAE